MTAKTTDKVLRAVTQRVMDSFTAQGALFTALDVSNAVKGTLPDIRHREVAPIVRDLYERGAMGDYRQAVAPRELPGHSLAQRPRTPGDGVLIDVVLNRLAGHVLNQLRRGKIGKPLRQIDAAVQIVQPRHLADDRLGELRRLLRPRKF